MKMKSVIRALWIFIVVAVLILVMLSPIYILAKISFSKPAEVLTQHPTLIIKEIVLTHWKKIFQSGNLWLPLFRSLAVATGTTLASLLIVVPAAYVVSRLSKGLRYKFIFALFFTRMFPVVGIALPISVQFLKWGMMDTVQGLVLANMITQIPFMAWILVSTFEGIPIDLEEAAYMDGASRIRSLVYIVLPAALQGIAVAAMYVWLNAWNEFTYAIYLSSSTKTLPIQIYYYVERGGFFDQAAYSTILTIPVIIITFGLQRYLKPDYLGGAIKG